MIAQLRTWFDTRSSREKWLILLMIGLMAVALIWGIARPVDEALSSARRRNADAAIRLAQTEAQVEAVKAIRKARPEAPAGALDAIVRTSGAAAGFTLDSVTPDGTRLRVHINSARGGALLAWLSSLEAQGVLIDQADITDAGNSTVAANLVFRVMAP